MKRLLIFLFAIAFAGPAIAQTAEDYHRRQADLNALSVVFGELHHIRRHCEPRREADLWRNRMKRMVELEEPSEAAKLELVRSFNSGFRGAMARYPSCDRRARDYAAARAAQGDAIVRRLAQPLIEAERNAGPLIVTIPQDNPTD